MVYLLLLFSNCFAKGGKSGSECGQDSIARLLVSSISKRPFYKWSFTSESVLRVFGGKKMSDPDASGSVETRSDIKNEEVGSLEELQWSYGAPGRDNPIYNRWVFNQRCQKPDESIGDFVNALRKLISGEIYKFKYRPVSPSEVAESQPLLEVNTYEYAL